MALHQDKPGDIRQSSSLLERMLDEAVVIAEDAKSYLKQQQPQKENGLAKLEQAAEISRITSRIGFTVSWLLTRMAVQAGEISQDEARQKEWRLDGHDICTDEGFDNPQFSETLRSLKQRSLNLFLRVDRLDRELDR